MQPDLWAQSSPGHITFATSDPHDVVPRSSWKKSRLFLCSICSHLIPHNSRSSSHFSTSFVCKQICDDLSEDKAVWDELKSENLVPTIAEPTIHKPQRLTQIMLQMHPVISPGLERDHLKASAAQIIQNLQSKKNCYSKLCNWRPTISRLPSHSYRQASHKDVAVAVSVLTIGDLQ